MICCRALACSVSYHLPPCFQEEVSQCSDRQPSTFFPSISRWGSISISLVPFRLSIATFPAEPMLFVCIALLLALVSVGRVTVFECANLCYCPKARRSHGDPTNVTQENVC